MMMNEHEATAIHALPSGDTRPTAYLAALTIALDRPLRFLPPPEPPS